jgi:hypothetical protein
VVAGNLSVTAKRSSRAKAGAVLLFQVECLVALGDDDDDHGEDPLLLLISIAALDKAPIEQHRDRALY